jgi:hypothetical protein
VQATSVVQGKVVDEAERAGPSSETKPAGSDPKPA